MLLKKREIEYSFHYGYKYIREERPYGPVIVYTRKRNKLDFIAYNLDGKSHGKGIFFIDKYVNYNFRDMSNGINGDKYSLENNYSGYENRYVYLK